MPDGLVIGILFAVVIAILSVAAPASPSREVETRTVRYSAAIIDDAQCRYFCDATLFTSTGWAVLSAAWDSRAHQPTLVATYARYADGDTWLKVAGWSLRSGARARRLSGRSDPHLSRTGP